MATELGQAYVQIMPSAKGISGMLKKQIDPEANSAGQSAGGKMSLGLKAALVAGAAAAGAIAVKTISASLDQGSKLQQSLGGIETLFKGSADKVKNYANEAYKTSGLSANDYMENVTSFSASLLQSLGGNTSKAADQANMAMVDMADNSNKMGTSLTDIQNAYQGFAKQNYTMLDNLKLGYGGTQEEMKRLLKDATKITGVKYNMSNLSDVYSAIHAIQSNLKITGTTAKEASSTFSGSFASMKSAAQNVLGKLSLGMDVGPDLKALATTTSNFLFKNFIPMVGNIIKGIPGAVSAFISAAGPSMMAQGKKLMSSLASGMSGGGKGISGSLGTTLTSAMNSVKSSLTGLDFSGVTAVGQKILPALSAGFQTFVKIAAPAIAAVVAAFKNMWNAAQPIVTAIASILMPAFQILGSFLGGVFQGILGAVSLAFNGLAVVFRILTPVIQFIVGIFKSLWNVFGPIIQWVAQTIGSFTGMGVAFKVIGGVLGSVWNVIKSAFNAGKTVISTVINAIKTVWSGFGTVFSAVGRVLKSMFSGIASVFKSGGNGIKAVFNALKSAWSAVGSLFSRVGAAIGKIPGQIWNFFKSVPGKITSAFSGIGTKIVGFFKGIPGKIGAAFKGIGNIGANLVKGLWSGITNMGQWIKDKISGFGKGVVNSLKSFFHIKSPSRLMRDEIGRYLVEGIGVGIEKYSNSAYDAMNELGAGIQGRVPSLDLGLTGTTGNVAATVVKHQVAAVANATQASNMNPDSRIMNVLERIAAKSTVINGSSVMPALAQYASAVQADRQATADRGGTVIVAR